MRILFFALMFAFSGPNSAQEVSERRMIETARSNSVQELDSTLPPDSLAVWLESFVLSSAEVVWEVNDCGEQTGGPADAGRDFPVCVEAIVVIAPGVKAHISMMVGTFKQGVIGKPKLFQLFVERSGKYEELKRLSEVQAVASSQPGGTRNTPNKSLQPTH